MVGNVSSDIRQLVSGTSQGYVSGTPQGSVLGPILFLLYINDLPDIFVSAFKSKLYADDLMSYKTFDYRSNPDRIQSSLNALVSWSKLWQLQLAVPKCGSILLKGYSSFEDEHELYIDDCPLAVLE